jgi:3-oxoacyl-[acyl-carrier protein] reductase
VNIDLEDKTALVTGGGRGLGREITFALTQAGASILLTFCTDHESAYDTIETASRFLVHGEMQAMQLNLDDEDSISRFLAVLHDQEVEIDVLVHNAGMNVPADFQDTGPDLVRRIMAVNLAGPFELTRRLLPLLSKDASVVWIGSSSADTGGPRSVHYAASKAGLQAVSRGLVANGIRSNVVQPGYLTSPMAEVGAMDPRVKEVIEGIPAGRLGTFEEVARLVLFLGSPASSYISGQVIRIDGGLTFGG